MVGRIMDTLSIRAGTEGLQGLWDSFVQTTHLGAIQLAGGSAWLIPVSAVPARSRSCCYARQQRQ